MWKLNPDGSLDPSFGQGGLFTSGAAGGGDDEGYGLALDSRGRIMVAGASRGPAKMELAIWAVE